MSLDEVRAAFHSLEAQQEQEQQQQQQQDINELQPLTREQRHKMADIFRPVGADGKALSEEETRTLAQSLDSKINDDYMTVEQMIELAGPTAFRAWVSATAENVSGHNDYKFGNNLAAQTLCLYSC